MIWTVTHQHQDVRRQFASLLASVETASKTAMQKFIDELE